MPGPFYFAWVDPTETTFGVEHHVEDESVFSVTIEQTEGNTATLALDIKNPKVGLLAPGRKVWAWLSWFDGSTIQPIFFGRLVGIPTNLLAEVCTLSFIAQPLDYINQKQVLAETLKVRPHYDPIFIDIAHRDDPDTVLEGYSALWHVDRLTLEYSISDILVGEDGTEVFNQEDSFYDSVQITLNETPLLSVFMDASVTWTQQAQGWVDIGAKTFETFAGSSILGSWPIAQPGVSIGAIGGGWSSYNSTAVDVFQTSVAFNISGSGSWTNTESHHETGDTMSSSESFNKPLLLGPSIEFIVNASGTGGTLDPFGDPPINIPANETVNSMVIPQWQINTTMVLQYDASRSRTEHLTFTLTSDLQAILTLPESPGTSATEQIQISGADVSIPLLSYHELTDVPFDPTEIPGYVPGTWPFGSSNTSSGLDFIGGGHSSGGHLYYIPIGNVSRRSYFPTDRGLWSIEYLISIARAHLLLRSRAVQVQFDCRFSRALALSCRKNAQIFDPRLPGGQAVGKIIGYQLKADGDSGELIGSVTIGCAVGRGNAIEALDGTPSYVAVGYVELGYQHYDGSVIVLPAGDIGYSIPKDAADDDGLVFPLDKGQVVLREQIHGSLGQQADVIANAIPAQIAMTNQQTPQSYDDLAAQTSLALQGINAQLKNVPIWYELQLKPVVNGPFEVQYAIDLTSLVVPKMIDLEAPSSP